MRKTILTNWNSTGTCSACEYDYHDQCESAGYARNEAFCACAKGNHGQPFAPTICKDKDTYPSRAHAAAAILAMQPDRYVIPYFCKGCHLWHITKRRNA